ncbi:MAG: tetratricopeptide repeat protein [Deltaproteobacteria bacterium]|nr:MAG: tetratricopeptide repeat protein [Deltaproteobacteria bacterium]
MPPPDAPPPDLPAPDAALEFDPGAPAASAGGDLEFDPTAGAPPADDLELDLGAAPAPSPAPEPAESGGPDLEILDFIDQEYQEAKEGGAKVREAGPTRYRVRRKSGKTFGPFDPEVIVSMLKEGQLLGNEEVSTDGAKWKPIGSVPQFAEAIQALMESATAGADLGVPGIPDDIDPDSVDVVAPKGRGYGVYGMAGARGVKEVEPKRSETALAALKRRWPLLVAATLLLSILGTGIYLGFTPYGYFGYKYFFTPGAGGGDKPTAELLAQARKGLEKDTYASYQEALANLEAALKVNPDDVEAQSLYAQAVFYLERKYGGFDAALRKAAAFMREIEVTAPDYPEFVKAKMGEAILKGEEAKVRPALARLAKTRPDDLEVLYLLGESYFREGNHKQATQYIDKIVVKNPKSAKAFHALAYLHTLVDTPEARETAIAYYEKALEVDGEHVASAIDLAQLYLSAADPDLESAGRALDKITPERLERAAPMEQGRYWYLRGILQGERGLVADAEKSFKKAIGLYPKSAFGRQAYGEFLMKRRNYEAAAKELEQAVALAPNDAYTNALLIETLILAGRRLDASKRLAAFKKAHPNSPLLSFLQGRLAEMDGEVRAAERAYRAALKKDPGFYRAALALGRLFLRERAIQDAEEPMRKAVEAAPTRPETHIGLGEYLLAANRPKEALAAFEKAIEIDPRHPGGHLGIARALAAMGQVEEAEKRFLEARELGPDYPGMEFYYGSFLYEQGRLEEAAQALTKAKEQDPKNSMVLARLGAVLYDLGRVDEAGTYLGMAANLSRKIGDAFYYLGLVYRKRGERRSAEEKLKIALDIEPENPRYHFALGEFYLEQNDYEEALAAFERAVTYDPNYAQAWERIGDVHLILNRYSKAEKAYKKALELHPEGRQVLTKIADAYVKAGQYKKSIPWYERALAGDAPVEEAYYKLARVYDDTGADKKAVKMYLKAVEVDPKNAMAHYYLGYAFKDLGKKKKAIEHFEAYLKSGDDPEFKAEVKDEIYYLKH